MKIIVIGRAVGTGLTRGHLINPVQIALIRANPAQIGLPSIVQILDALERGSSMRLCSHALLRLMPGLGLVYARPGSDPPRRILPWDRCPVMVQCQLPHSGNL